MSLPPSSQPWRPKAARVNTNNTGGGNNNNQNNNGGNNNNNNSRQSSFETDGQISNRTGARGQSHVSQAFQKYGQQGGGGGNYNNNDNSIPMPQSRAQQQAKAAAAAAAAAQQNQPQTFNIEDALDAFENIKVSPLAERATDWAPVTDSGVTYEAVHKDIDSFYRMCSDAQKNKK